MGLWVRVKNVKVFTFYVYENTFCMYVNTFCELSISMCSSVRPCVCLCGDMNMCVNTFCEV